MSYLLEYISEIESGNIRVGKELASVLYSLKGDMKNPDYIYDEGPGRLRINLYREVLQTYEVPF